MHTLLGWVLVTMTVTGEPILQLDETTGQSLYKIKSDCQRDAVQTYAQGVIARCLPVRG